MPKVYFSKLEAPTKVAESLSIEEVRTLDGFEGLKAAWNDLVERGGSSPLSSNFAFALYWWKWRNYGNQLFILLARDGERIEGIAPLMVSEVRRGPITAKKVAFMFPRYLESDYIVEPGLRRECTRKMIEHANESTGCRYLEFCGIPEESGSLPIIEELAVETGMRVSRTVHAVGCYLPLEGTWDSFLKEKSVSFRKDLRYYERQLQRKGNLETFRFRRTEDLPGLMKKLVAVDAGSWKAERSALAENRRLVEDLLEACNEDGSLDVFLTELDGLPVAYLFIIHWGGKATAMFTSYSLEHEASSPGMVCFSHAIRQLFRDREVSEVDFISSYPYLRRWTDRLRSRYIVTLYPGRVSGRAIKLTRDVLHRGRSTFAGGRPN